MRYFKRFIIDVEAMRPIPHRALLAAHSQRSGALPTYFGHSSALPKEFENLVADNLNFLFTRDASTNLSANDKKTKGSHFVVWIFPSPQVYGHECVARYCGHMISKFETRYISNDSGNETGLALR